MDARCWAGGALAAYLALVVFCLTIFVKQLAYGPYWSMPDRPMFAYGWPIPWKWETQGGTSRYEGLAAVALAGTNRRRSHPGRPRPHARRAAARLVLLGFCNSTLHNLQ